VLDECEQAGILNIWLQPGAESPELIDKLEAGPFNWLAHACIMVRASMAPVVPPVERGTARAD
jgi:predicted CoA-binding protein